MADPFPPPGSEDELDVWASSVVDGSADDEIVRRAASDPELAARVDELRRVRTRLADVAPVDPATTRKAVAAVLAALDAAAPAPAEPTTAGSPAPRSEAAATPPAPAALADRRPRSRWRRPVGPLVGAAAAVALLLAGTTAVLVSRDGEQIATTRDVATEQAAGGASADAAASPPAEAADRSASSSADGGSPAAGPATTQSRSFGAAEGQPAGAVVDLGVHADDGSLRRAAFAALGTPLPTATTVAAPPSAAPSSPTPATPTPLLPEVGRCSTAPALGPDPRALAVVGGRRVAVAVIAEGVVVLDLLDCSVRVLPR